MVEACCELVAWSCVTGGDDLTQFSSKSAGVLLVVGVERTVPVVMAVFSTTGALLLDLVYARVVVLLVCWPVFNV
jgi:hypothetical protein